MTKNDIGIDAHLSETDENNSFGIRFGKGMIGLAKKIAIYRPLLSIALTVMLVAAASVMTAFGQPPNPFGGSGSTKASNAASNILVYLTWGLGIVGIISILMIGVKKFFEQEYKHYIWSAAIGLGGFAILGSVAYDIVNLSSVDINDPTVGN